MAEQSLRDIIESAVEATPEIETPASAVAEAAPATETAFESSERVRDAAGRFAKAEPEVVAEAEKPASRQARVPRPSSWKKDYWEKWDSLAEQDPALAEYLNQREQQYAQGVSAYKSEADRAREWNELVTPHASRLQQFGATPTEYVGRLLQMDQVLSTGTVEQKQAMLNAIAQAVGLSPQTASSPQGQTPGQAYVPPELLRAVTSLQQKVDGYDRWQQRQEQAAINEEINEFAKEAPYLDDLIEPMAQLLERGAAESLEEAYQIALVKDDTLFRKFLSEQRGREAGQGQDAQKRAAAAERARQVAVSPRSSTPTGSSQTSTQGGTDIRSHLNAAFDSIIGAGGGRI